MVFAIMSIIVYIFPKFFQNTYGVAMITLLISLIAIIVFELMLIFTGTYNVFIEKIMFFANFYGFFRKIYYPVVCTSLR